MRPPENFSNEIQYTPAVQKNPIPKNPNLSNTHSRKRMQASRASFPLLNRADRQGNPKELALWARFKNGSESAFTLIYTQHIVSLYNYGELITPNKELIEDSIHDLFVDLWKNKSTLGTTFSIKFYLFKGLKRKIIKGLYIKRKMPTVDYSRDDHYGSIFSHEMNLVSKEISEEQNLSLFRAMDKLSNRQKEAIVLRFYDNLSYKEIGALLSISVKSTYTLIYRSIDILKQNIGKIYLAVMCLDNIFS